MESITWMAPILPGKSDAWVEFHETMTGSRREEHDASRRRMGVHREVASLMKTPHGDFVCLFHEVDSLPEFFHAFATSDDPYDVWFRGNVEDLHGVTAEMLAGPPPATKMMDWQG